MPEGAEKPAPMNGTKPNPFCNSFSILPMKSSVAPFVMASELSLRNKYPARLPCSLPLIAILLALAFVIGPISTSRNHRNIVPPIALVSLQIDELARWRVEAIRRAIAENTNGFGVPSAYYAEDIDPARRQAMSHPRC